jgi:hypothetical protein
MTDIFEFMDDLKELQLLYGTGELCHHDFVEKIQKYESMIETFELAMEAQQ